MLLASGGGLIMADHMPFFMVYQIMAACLLPGVVTTLLAPEPKINEGTPENMKQAVFDPLIEYFSRRGALWILAFILFYKIGDTMASAMTIPFYLDIGFSKTLSGYRVFKNPDWRRSKTVRLLGDHGRNSDRRDDHVPP